MGAVRERPVYLEGEVGLAPLADVPQPLLEGLSRGVLELAIGVAYHRPPGVSHSVRIGLLLQCSAEYLHDAAGGLAASNGSMDDADEGVAIQKVRDDGRRLEGDVHGEHHRKQRIHAPLGLRMMLKASGAPSLPVASSLSLRSPR
jgi:hypothetical protein